MSKYITRKDYQNAVTVQNACNLSGVVSSFNEVFERIWKEARALGLGTEYVNTHPICVLYADKIQSLTSEASGGFSVAYSDCDRFGKEEKG